MYTVLNKTRHYEVRKYPTYKYVVAMEEDCPDGGARSDRICSIVRRFCNR